MKSYKAIKRLRAMSGFGWNPETKAVTADEDTWARLAEGVRPSS